MPALAAAPMTEAVKANYRHLSDAEFADLRAATRRLRFRFEPGIGLLHAPITSRFVNVDRHGIRSNDGAGRPIARLDGALWFLGGSTAFGDSIADHETIPAQLERQTGRITINLGVPGYSSSRENVLMSHYLRLGYRPSLVVFLDGINESCEPEPYQREMRELFARAQQEYVWDAGGPLRQLLVRAGRKARKIAGAYRADEDAQTLECTRDGRQNSLAEIHQRILGERAALCAAYGVDCRTLVQPFAGTHGPSSDLPGAFMNGDGKDLRDLYYHLESGWRSAGAVFVTDALDGFRGHPFVDEVHYSAEASRTIAATIAARIGLSGAHERAQGIANAIDVGVAEVKRRRQP
ncbi:MAG: SGNH/GDSL hydrolase family protein [Cyanobacteria bacterium]|nr:SGNH/GDSL hydrolase family protein [Cyanobacteriota bacterium]